MLENRRNSREGTSVEVIEREQERQSILDLESCFCYLNLVGNQPVLNRHNAIKVSRSIPRSSEYFFSLK